MSGKGMLSWDTPFVFDHPWLDGAFMERATCPLSWDPESGLVLAGTHAGTHVAQRWIGGTKCPREMMGRKFTLQALVWSEEDCYRLMACQSKGLVQFSTGQRCVDVFEAVTGENYLLRRPLADGVVTGVSSVTHPTIFLLDGVVDSGAATVTGQSMTALKTGQIQVRYTPVHWVKLMAGFNIPSPNELRSPVGLEEAILGDFD